MATTTLSGHLNEITPPTEQPVSRREAQEWMRIDCDDDAHLIDAVIKAATANVQEYLNRQLVTATWDYFLDRFNDPIQLPLAPLQSVTSVSYVDNDGATQTLSTDVYTVDANREPGMVYRSWNQNWPSIRTIRNAVTIRFVAGYGAASTVPDEIKAAIKMSVVDIYENRGKTSELRNADNMTWQRLLWPRRVQMFH